MEALGINLGYLIVQILNFAILFVVLRKWVYRPVVGLLQKRQETIAQGLEDARVAEQARQNAEQEAEKIISEAQQEANKIVREATERAEQAATDLRGEAEQEVEEIRQTAMAEGQQLKGQALTELRGQVASLAIAAAEKVVGENLDQKKQQKLIDEFFGGADALAALEGRDLTGDGITVTSALPLTDREQGNVQKAIEKLTGSTTPVEFRSDPSILGGLVVRVGDKVIDASAAGKLSELEHSLA